MKTLLVIAPQPGLAEAVRAEGIEPLVVPSIMTDPAVATALARAVLDASA